MQLSNTYICVSDMSESLAFYKMLLNKNPDFQNENRWAEFHCGNTLCLYNEQYDEKIIAEHNEKEHFNKAYVDIFKQDEKKKVNTMVVFNFVVDDIDIQYERIQKAHIEVSPLLYVNIFKPYWYFTVYDPDGNEIEITGERKS